MNNSFATAMSRALEHTRAADPTAAATGINARAAMRGQPRRGPDHKNGARNLVPTVDFHVRNDKTVHSDNAGVVLSHTNDMVSGTARENGRKPACALSRASTERMLTEECTINVPGHAWTGGCAAGSHTKLGVIDASAEMTRFFLALAKEKTA